MPTTALVCVIVACESVRARAMPKSMTFTLPSEVSMMLPGLMSRCTRWLACEYCRADRTPETISMASLIGTAVPSEMSSLTVCPSTYSMTMYGMARDLLVASDTISSPVSYTATMFG